MKSNRQARRVLNMPHWLSNTQFQAKCKRTGKWVVTQTNSWSVPCGFYLSRQRSFEKMPCTWQVSTKGVM
ncbi:stationary-phase-induced ribosome-associated protein [Serratia sp. JSRIV006]|uniref:stationary-phase-induced ribosome-associated protein n=1 Tax=Serratia sp. JSRIV006 TaxID=2831896 RepID=UPI001CBE6588|nr:stationary-phase-induced ribosome-associated protein [Serratia sp. JSRIV006]